jgi:hypothetical protein
MDTAAGAFEGALEIRLFANVAQACDLDVQPGGTEQFEESADAHRSAHGHDADAFGVELAPDPHRQAFDGNPIADPFDKHNAA